MKNPKDAAITVPLAGPYLGEPEEQVRVVDGALSYHCEARAARPHARALLSNRRLSVIRQRLGLSPEALRILKGKLDLL